MTPIPPQDEPVEREVYELADAYLRGELTAEGVTRLRQLVCGDARARRFYVRFMFDSSTLHGWARDQWATQAGPAASEVTLDAAYLLELQSQAPGAAETETEGPCVPPGAACPPLDSPSSPTLGFLADLSGESFMGNIWMWGVMALMSLMTISVMVLMVVMIRGAGRSQEMADKEPSPGPPPASRTAEVPSRDVSPAEPAVPSVVARLVHAHQCQWRTPDEAPEPGDSLESGQKLELASGLAEIRFQKGARVILEGPATFELQSNNSAYLRSGKLTAKVSKRAVNFTVETPWARVVDLGTEFGIQAAAAGRGEVHVFVGSVAVSAPTASTEGPGNDSVKTPPASAPAPGREPFVLHQGEAASVAPDRPIVKTQARLAAFTARMPGEPLPIFGTGRGVAIGQQDPHWWITAMSHNPDFRPEPAVVGVQYGDRGDQRDAAKWVSFGQKPLLAPPGCRWTFRTKFDLSGFDPAAVRIEGIFSVDDFLAEVRLNGRPLPLPAGAREAELYVKKTPLVIDRGFVAGENVLEIVIENASVGVGDSAMGLYLDLKGTARPIKP